MSAQAPSTRARWVRGGTTSCARPRPWRAEGRGSPSGGAGRLGGAVEILASKLGAPVSGDPSRAEPARAAFEAGAAIINDVRGLTADPALAPPVAKAGAGGRPLG